MSLALALVLFPVAASAQQPPARRLELADSARSAPQTDPRLSAPLRETPRTRPRTPLTPEPKRGAGLLRDSFVRDQALLGLLVYGPSFAATVTNEPVAWSAAYVVVGGGSYFAASELSRNLTITEPTAWLATQSAVRGALAGWALAYTGDVNRHHRAAGIFFGSVAGTAAALAMGRAMTDGEVAATTFGADLSALTGLALTHMADPGATGRARAGVVAVTGLAGYPLGYLYASRAPYRVTPGDVTTLWTSAAIGAMAAGALIENGNPGPRTVAAMLMGGAIAGTLIGDRLLVRPRDHSPEDGQIVALWAVGGGLMGAGVGVLSGAAHDRMSAATAGLMAAGAIGGVYFAERYLAPPSGQSNRRQTALNRVELNAAGALAAVSRLPGAHPLLRWTF